MFGLEIITLKNGSYTLPFLVLGKVISMQAQMILITYVLTLKLN